MSIKECKTCKKFLNGSCFRLQDRLNSNALRSTCKVCDKLKSREYKASNPDKIEKSLNINREMALNFKGTEKKCNTCKVILKVECFGKNRSRKDGLCEICKECRNTKIINKKWGFGPYDKNRMLEKQNYRCAICLKNGSEFKVGLAVDHCHRTGKIRGLLCPNCNTGIGSLMDNVSLLEVAIAYLKNNKGTT